MEDCGDAVEDGACVHAGGDAAILGVHGNGEGVGGKVKAPMFKVKAHLLEDEVAKLHLLCVGELSVEEARFRSFLLHDLVEQKFEFCAKLPK